MNQEHTGRAVRHSLSIASPPHRVYQAWTDPARVVEWFCDHATGGVLPGDTVDWSFDGFDESMRYRVVHIKPGKELLFAVEMPGADGALLEITLEAEPGGTVVHLVNSGFPEAPEMDEIFRGCDSGWDNALRYSKLYLERYWQRPKHSAIALRQGGFDHETAMEWFRPGIKRGRWLDVPDSGLRLLWDTGRHVTYAWDAVDGTLECETFSGKGGKPTLGLRSVSWAARAPQGLQARFENCLDRLAKLLIS